MAKSPLELLKEVRQETAKVTWPTRKETMVTTIAVFVMSSAAAVFFLVVDQILQYGVQTILRIGS